MTEERAVLAGGCFWGVQDLFRRYDGVLSTRVGYTGGNTPNATYRNHGTHGAHHVQQIQQFQAKQYDEEAKTWAAMTAHMYVIADALAGGIAKQFPDKFR